MQHYQRIPYVLPSQTFAAGTRTNQTLRDLPKQLFGRMCHLEKVVFDITITPTFSVANTEIGNNNLFTATDFWDGTYMRFQGGLNHLRAKERMATGRLRLPDADLTASTTARVFRRVMHMGPPHFEQYPADWVVPTGALENGEIRFTHGALADIAAAGGTVSACTGSARVVAWLVLLDELRIPPAYQFVNQNVNAADFNMAGRALYEALFLMNSSSFDAFTSGGLGNIRVDFGQGDVVPSVHVANLQAGYNDDFASGEFSQFIGDAESSTGVDANHKMVVHTSGSTNTIGVGKYDLQPVLWTPPDGRISKLLLAETVARLRWDGTATSVLALVSRILPQPASVIAAQTGRALGRLNLTPKSIKVKTKSKGNYTGPYGEFMPWKVSL